MWLVLVRTFLCWTLHTPWTSSACGNIWYFYQQAQLSAFLITTFKTSKAFVPHPAVPFIWEKTLTPSTLLFVLEGSSLRRQSLANSSINSTEDLLETHSCWPHSDLRIWKVESSHLHGACSNTNPLAFQKSFHKTQKWWWCIPVILALVRLRQGIMTGLHREKHLCNSCLLPSHSNQVFSQLSDLFFIPWGRWRSNNHSQTPTKLGVEPRVLPV